MRDCVQRTAVAPGSIALRMYVHDGMKIGGLICDVSSNAKMSPALLAGDWLHSSPVLDS